MSVDFNSILGDAMGVFGTAVTYQPIAGAPFQVTVMEATDDREINVLNDTRIKQNGGTFEARVTELTQPAQGDSFVFAGKTYVVKSYRRPDESRLLWFLDCSISA